MLLLLPEFDGLTTDTVEETCSLLRRHQGNARVLAGGTDLLVKMKHRRVVPRHLINIKRIRGLDQIRHGTDGLRIGALTTIQSIKDSPVIARMFPLLSEAAGKVGTVHIRNLGTLGGNLANASPSAEFAPALLTYGASIRCARLGGERLIPIEEFFAGPGKTAMQDDELLTEVHVPAVPASGAGIYLKHSFRRMDVAIAAAAVVIHLEGHTCREARIALGSVAPVPFRARSAEAALNGQILEKAGKARLFAEAAHLAAEESLPIDDVRGFAAYRREVVGTLVRQALEAVTARIGA